MTHPANLIIGHYERHAAAWDADRQNSGWNDKVWHDLFIDNLATGARVLDLGCGSGRPVAQHMAQRGLRVTGVDSSRAMISLCRNRLPDHEWIVADMRELSLERRFGGILAGTVSFTSATMTSAECSLYSPTTHPPEHC
jgi:ubiquinone/menaquinone biosynthesis C-methylase UbiE